MQFTPCFERVLKLEGGYQLTNIPGDAGGQTYAGISRKMNPGWLGWSKIDKGEFGIFLKDLVKIFYRINFWDRILGDKIESPDAAFMIYDFSVNAGVKTSVKIAQGILGVKQDGYFGPKTLKALNSYTYDEDRDRLFVLEFSLAKVFRYKDICLGNPGNRKFICGWLNRVQEGVNERTL